MIILGICDNHDSGACLLKDGRVIAAVNEERLTREKMIGGFPANSVKEVCKVASVSPESIDRIIYASYMTPSCWLRMAEGMHRGLRESSLFTSYLLNLYIIYQVFAYKTVIPSRLEKFLSSLIMKRKSSLAGLKGEVVWRDHHYCHAAGAYYTCGFKGNVLVVTADAMGDGLSVTVNIGKNGVLKRIFSQTGFSAISTYYSRLTESLGFKPVRHEGKITGLSAYGKLNPEIYGLAKKKFYFCPSRKGFNLKNHFVSDSLTLRQYRSLIKEHSREDFAFNFQKIFEEEVVKFVDFWMRKTGISDVALSGGAFSNVSVNKKISEIKNLSRIYIFPHMGDGGLAMGAALLALPQEPYCLENMFFGPEYSNGHIKNYLNSQKVRFIFMEEESLCSKVASLLYEGRTIAHFRSRMEFGPRALGNRSILYRADDPSCTKWLNDKMKRDYFMPFAPINLAEEGDTLYLNTEKCGYTLRFMNIAVDCSEKMKKLCPAAVHVDGTARPQQVYENENPRMFGVLKAYKKLKGISVVINTSFNMHEEPIVCSPEDAVRCFYECGLDYLVLNNFLISRE